MTVRLPWMCCKSCPLSGAPFEAESTYREKTMDYQLKGKYAFVNAGAYGIGEATADLLTQEGASVIVADREESVLREKASRWRGVVAADLATPQGTEMAVSYVLKTFGRAPD